MIHFRCGRCAGWLGAGGGDAGSAITCRRCGHINICPASSGTRSVEASPERPSSSGRWLWTAIGAGVVALAAWNFWPGVEPSGAGAPMPSATSPAAARQQEILEQNAGRSGDPDLIALYQEINRRHFAGVLPQIAVRWEPALADVGALAAQAFTLEGMFGRAGKHLLILLNPSVKADPRALERALCHEMVHAHLFTLGDTTTNHGPAFKAVLRRLSADGAFEGIEASDSDKASLRAWLDAESARLDTEREEMNAIGSDIARERDEMDRAFAALNARTTAARAEGGARPSAAEIEDLNSRRDRFNQHVVNTNARVEQDREGLAHFNREVARYNLMTSYPDGLDEESSVRPKPAMPGAGGR